MKTIKISELITALEKIKTDAGDLPVVISGDSEGNRFGTLDLENSFGWECGIATIWPWEQFTEFEDVEGYFPNDEDEEKG